MYLSYTDLKGKIVNFELGTDRVIIGRSDEANVTIDDEEASRFHAVIIFWEGDYVIKDLKTPNGMFVNGKSVAVAMLALGDVIGVGNHNITLEKKAPVVGKGPSTVIRHISKEMEEGKGYKTIMKEIIRDAEAKEDKKRGPAA